MEIDTPSTPKRIQNPALKRYEFANSWSPELIDFAMKFYCDKGLIYDYRALSSEKQTFGPPPPYVPGQPDRFNNHLWVLAHPKRDKEPCNQIFVSAQEIRKFNDQLFDRNTLLSTITPNGKISHRDFSVTQLVWRWTNNYAPLDPNLDISHIWSGTDIHDKKEIAEQRMLYLCQESHEENVICRIACKLRQAFRGEYRKQCNDYPPCWGDKQPENYIPPILYPYYEKYWIGIPIYARTLYVTSRRKHEPLYKAPSGSFIEMSDPDFNFLMRFSASQHEIVEENTKTYL